MEEQRGKEVPSEALGNVGIYWLQVSAFVSQAALAPRRTYQNPTWEDSSTVTTPHECLADTKTPLGQCTQRMHHHN